QVERLSEDGVTWLVVGSLAANSTSFSMTGLASGKTYTFRVRAFNAQGFSQASNLAELKMPLPDLNAVQSPILVAPARAPKPAVNVRGGGATIIPPLLPDT
ncbi:MAG TPA: fibronectin type III domain-containing protein, partial [Tepidisphaeraceae bacterium]